MESIPSHTGSLTEFFLTGWLLALNYVHSLQGRTELDRLVVQIQVQWSNSNVSSYVSLISITKNSTSIWLGGGII